MKDKLILEAHYRNVASRNGWFILSPCLDWFIY